MWNRILGQAVGTFALSVIAFICYRIITDFAPSKRKSKRSPAYRVEPEGRGCTLCGHGVLWDVVGPDEIALSTSYENREDAEWICDNLNAAYKLGLNTQ